MEKHLDVIGYLLAAVVFSVGFASERAHSTLEAISRDVSELSWRLREALAAGRRIGPGDLPEALSFLRRSRDPVAIFSRLLNVALLVLVTVGVVDALVLIHEGTSAPRHAYVLLAMLGSAALAVAVMGELDLRRVSREQRRVLEESTLGRLDATQTNLRQGKIDAARVLLDDLMKTYPGWSWLLELDAFLDYKAGLPDRGLATVQSLVEASVDLYMSPIVSTACAVSSGHAADALPMLHRMRRRDVVPRYAAELADGLALEAAHLTALFATPPTTREATREVRSGNSAASYLVGASLEPRANVARSIVLDLELDDTPETKHLSNLLTLWRTGTQASRLSEAAQGSVLGTVLDQVFEPKASPIAEEVRTTSTDPLTLETLALVALVRGDVLGARELFDRAIRVAPTFARAQWGRALVVDRLGWHDQAHAALQRAQTLDPRWRILQVTSRRLDGRSTSDLAAVASELYSDGMSDRDRFELAMLGVLVDRPILEPAANERRKTVRDLWIASFTALALESAVRSSAPRPVSASS